MEKLASKQMFAHLVKVIIIFVTDKDSNFKFGMATLLGKLYKYLEFEAAILNI